MSKITEIRLSGQTYTIEDSSALHNLDSIVTSDGSNAVASSGIYDAITAATSALAETIGQEMSAKADTTAMTQAISEATSGKADTTAVTQAISEATSGKLDTSVFETYSGNVDTALASKIAGASWDSNTSHLNFYDNVSATGTPLTYVDGADWVKDSFLKSVTIEDKEISGETVTCLVFVFETESGETETDIPLTDIFDPDNYVSLATYTAYTAATDTVLQGKVDNSVYTAYTAATEAVLSGKADTTAVTQSISEATSGKVDTTTYTAYTAATDTALAGKQETLVNQTNIKSINNQSLLGSGDLTIDTGNKVEVSGTTLVFL